jgi:hypothetical protein
MGTTQLKLAQERYGKSRSTSGPILNALSFPLPLSGISPPALSSEIEAWKVMERLPFCPIHLPFPFGQMRWGLAALDGSRHWMHVDSNGLGTFVKTQCGSKWWIVFCLPPGLTKHLFGSIYQFLQSFDTNAEKGGRWDLANGDAEEHNWWTAEAVYLTAGTQL